MTSSVSRGAASMIGTSSAAASTTCSKLSSTTRSSLPASSALIASTQLADSPSRRPRARPNAGTTCAGSESGARSTSSAPSAKLLTELARQPRSRAGSCRSRPARRARRAGSAGRAEGRGACEARRHGRSRRVDGAGTRRPGGRAGARCGQRRVVRQDPPLEVAELGAGLEPELGVEVGAALPVARERVGLPARPGRGRSSAARAGAP